ncbi:hypothetical protein ABT095_20825 [Kitasatospora sp. NPDC002227]|uniref:hypothetical protein n=1 Tax=Kitasatospora sp. NPDC002227 TaxID=3154773 RepID=UPI00331EF672
MIDRAMVLARLQETELADRQGIGVGEAIGLLCDIAIVDRAAIEAQAQLGDGSAHLG